MGILKKETKLKLFGTYLQCRMKDERLLKTVMLRMVAGIDVVEDKQK